nr:hypothetical protein [Ectobacillus panaciterrae]
MFRHAATRSGSSIFRRSTGAGRLGGASRGGVVSGRDIGAFFSERRFSSKSVLSCTVHASPTLFE